MNEFGAELQSLIDDMVETMRQAPGVGLAAPQVDVPLQVIVVEFAEEDEVKSEDEEQKPPSALYAVVNPQIARFSEEIEIGTEGCLSIPGFIGDVERPVAVTIKGLQPARPAGKIKAQGWLARIFQHEIDHLEGVLFIDRAVKVWKLR